MTPSATLATGCPLPPTVKRFQGTQLALPELQREVLGDALDRVLARPQ